MEFLQNLKKNLSTAADYTVKKTTEATEAARLAMDIREKTGRLNAVYTELGRTVYTGRKKSTLTEEVIDAYVDEADALRKEIAALKTKLARAQGRILCPACGEKCKGTANFCPNCGAKLPKEEPAAKAAAAVIPAEEPAAEDAAEQE